MILLLAFSISLAFCLLLCSRYSPLNVVDDPNGRSLHDVVIQCTGGIALLLSVALSWLVVVDRDGLEPVLINISVAALPVAVISFMDDKYGLSVRSRLFMHALAAGLLVSGGLVFFEGWIGAVFTWIAIIWMLNLYNFMDGMDGFSGGMTLFGCNYSA